MEITAPLFDTQCERLELNDAARVAVLQALVIDFILMCIDPSDRRFAELVRADEEFVALLCSAFGTTFHFFAEPASYEQLYCQ